ncbi:MAG: Ca-activated chloride channel family protein [Myxococcota bacterium]
MRSWLKKHRLAVGYVLVAVISTAMFMLALRWLPTGEAWLSERGYTMETPQFLVLAVIIPILWFVRLHSLTDMPLAQQLVSTTLRSVAVFALILALTRITHTSHEARNVATVVVVDVSESVPDDVLAEARDHLQALYDVRGNSLVRLVTFSETAAVVPLTPDTTGTLPDITRHQVGSLGTDLQQAMRLAYGLYPPGFHKRMVVITDGNETRGNALAEAETAVRLGVRVHYRTLGELELRKELMVLALDVPEDIEPNVAFSASVQLQSNHKTTAECTLKVDGLVAAAETVETTAAEQTVGFDDIRVRKGGEHAFQVDCKPSLAGASDADLAALDGFSTNNGFGLTRLVPEKKKLLYVEGEALYSNNFRDALADDFEVEVTGQRGIPNTLAKAKQYKAIVISDVPRLARHHRQNMTDTQMRMLHKYAKGGGMLLFTGGDSSLGPGGYGDTYLERAVLPVRLDVEHELETPRLALVLVIDKSGSMSGRKLKLAKKAARETVKALDKRDLVGIVAFDSGATVLIRLTRATSTRRFEIPLSKLEASGGTAIYEALEKGIGMLSGVDAQVKHVILMTDGQSNKTGVANPVHSAARNKITVSTIAVGSGSDRAMLQEIAMIGKGRHYFTESAEAIPKLFVDETREVAGESIKEEPARASLNRKYRNLRFLKGVNVSSAPVLGGYVPTQAKRKAEVIMTIGEGDPLLARWKQGKGWVYVFTSDIKNKWGKKWLRWAGFAPLWRQLIKDGLVEEKKKRVFPIEVTAARHRLTIGTDAISEKDQFISGVESIATVTGPDGKQSEITLSQSAPGRYEAQVDAPLYGPYRVDVVHKQDGKEIAISTGRATYPYPEEHLRFEADLARVASLSETTGGSVNPLPAKLLTVNGEEITSKSPAWHWLLYLVLALLFVDVLLRRIRLWPARTARLASVSAR